MRANERTVVLSFWITTVGKRLRVEEIHLLFHSGSKYLLSSYEEPWTTGDTVEGKKDRIRCLLGFDIFIGQGSKLYHMLESISFMVKHPKGNWPWTFVGRTDAEAKALIFQPPDAKSWLTGKDPDVGKDWGQEKGVTEDEMLGWHHQHSGHGSERTQGDSEGQGSPGMLQSVGLQRVTWLSKWTTAANGTGDGEGEWWGMLQFQIKWTRSISPRDNIWAKTWRESMPGEHQG